MYFQLWKEKLSVFFQGLKEYFIQLIKFWVHHWQPFHLVQTGPFLWLFVDPTFVGSFDIPFFWPFFGPFFGLFWPFFGPFLALFWPFFGLFWAFLIPFSKSFNHAILFIFRSNRICPSMDLQALGLLVAAFADLPDPNWKNLQN